MLHALERGRETIKQATGKLHNSIVVHKASQTQRTHLRTRGCTAMGKGWKATVIVTIHDKMSHLRHRGVGGGKLRHRGNYQDHINEPQIR